MPLCDLNYFKHPYASKLILFGSSREGVGLLTKAQVGAHLLKAEIF
jgi:hypothetical protein